MGNDLVRRGGSVLTEEDKRRQLEEEFLDKIMDDNKLVRLLVKDAPASGITRAGLFDRKNLNLPFADGRVALLGDAAHPQSPMMGQGANMAIVDAYVVTQRIIIAASSPNNTI